MAYISISDLSKSFGNEPVVDSVNLEIVEGSFTSFLGPSGCGKTTLLRMITGLEEPDAGNIQIGDQIVFCSHRKVDIPVKKRGIGLVFQSYALFPHMTVFGNIAYGLKTKKIPKIEIAKKVYAILSTMKMEDLKDRYPSELSGGQQQRVAIARMLVVDLKILLMDEPLSNLDAKLRVEMRTELKRIHRETGITVVYVTHDQIEAFSLSTHVAVMNEGRIQQYDVPDRIYDRPENLFVAGFIGTPYVNLLSGVVTSGESRKVRIEGDVDLTFPKGFEFKGLKDVVVAVRPEDLRIHQEMKESTTEYTIDEVFNAGATRFMNLTRKASTLLVSVERHFTVKRFDTIHVEYQPSSCNVYCKKSGKICG